VHGCDRPPVPAVYVQVCTLLRQGAFVAICECCRERSSGARAHRPLVDVSQAIVLYEIFFLVIVVHPRMLSLSMPVRSPDQCGLCAYPTPRRSSGSLDWERAPLAFLWS